MGKRPNRKILVLVVAAVVAIPPSMMIAGYLMGKRANGKAGNAKALAVCFELEQAIQRFYNDNGTMPVDGIISDVTIDSNSAEGLQMLRVLLNLERGDAGFSARGIKYLYLKEGSNGMDGLAFNENGNQVTGLYDPWGGSYMICLDGDFDEKIEVQPKAQRESVTLQRRVAVWSDGVDVQDRKDDVTTW